MSAYLRVLKRSGASRQVVLSALLCVVIVGALGASIYRYVKSNAIPEIKDYPLTMKCTKCGQEFQSTQNTALKFYDHNARTAIMDCPSCGEQKSCLPEDECPKCHKKSILPSVMAAFQGENRADAKDVCPNCGAEMTAK